MANKTVYPYGTDGSLPSSVGIINDLHTGGADKALSAEMGKYLGNTIFGTNETTVINIADLQRVGFMISADNSWLQYGETYGSSVNYGRGVLIPVSQYSTITIVTTAGIALAFLRNDSMASGETPNYSDSYPTRQVVNGTQTYYVPEDADYLFINTNIKDGSDVSPYISSLSGSSIASGAVMRDEIIDDLNSDTAIAPLSARQGMVLKSLISGGTATEYKRIHPVTQFGESRNGTITTVYDSEYTKMDVERYRGANILVHNMHSASGCSQILDASNAVLSTFSGENTAVGTVKIPSTAKWFVISNSFVKNPDFYVSVPSEMGDNDGLIFGENFLFDYDAGDFSQFNGTVVSGKGLQLPGTGASNGLVLDKVIDLDNWSLIADILTSDNSETVSLGTKITQPGSANHSTRVDVAFGNASISIYNNATNTLVVSESISSIISGNIYTVKLERIDRNIKATLINRTTGQSVSVVSNDYPQGSGQEGINAAGKMFDSPIFYVGSGTPWLQNLYATCLTRAKVLIVGDSITAGAHTTYENTWAPKAAEYFGNSISGGRGSGQVLCCLNQLRSLIPVVKPKAVIVTIGTNYISNIAKSGYAGLFKSIVNLIREYDAIPIVNNVCACDARKTGLTIINEVVDELKQIGCRFDLATSLNNDWDDGQDSQYYYTDDVHLNDAGNTLLYNIVTTQLGWLKNI